jgi:predicted nucleic acid-binding protein
MPFVLDASIALSWCFIDETTKLSSDLLEKLDTDFAYVPALWPLDVGNILVSAVRKKRIKYAEMIDFLELINSLNIIIDHETAAKGFHEILLLAHNQELTTYDATYLELALRRGLPLASKDQQLCNVAIKLGVKILPD